MSRGPMTATTIYQSQDDESGGLLLSGGFTNTQVNCVFAKHLYKGILKGEVSLYH